MHKHKINIKSGVKKNKMMKMNKLNTQLLLMISFTICFGLTENTEAQALGLSKVNQCLKLFKNKKPSTTNYDESTLPRVLVVKKGGGQSFVNTNQRTRPRRNRVNENGTLAEKGISRNSHKAEFEILSIENDNRGNLIREEGSFKRPSEEGPNGNKLEQRSRKDRERDFSDVQKQINQNRRGADRTIFNAFVERFLEGGNRNTLVEFQNEGYRASEQIRQKQQMGNHMVHEKATHTKSIKSIVPKDKKPYVYYRDELLKLLKDPETHFNSNKFLALLEQFKTHHRSIAVDPIVNYFIGLYYFKTGNLTKAIQALEVALRNHLTIKDTGSRSLDDELRIRSDLSYLLSFSLKILNTKNEQLNEIELELLTQINEYYEGKSAMMGNQRINDYLAKIAEELVSSRDSLLGEGVPRPSDKNHLRLNMARLQIYMESGKWSDMLEISQDILRRYVSEDKILDLNLRDTDEGGAFLLNNKDLVITKAYLYATLGAYKSGDSQKAETYFNELESYQVDFRINIKSDSETQYLYERIDQAKKESSKSS